MTGLESNLLVTVPLALIVVAGALGPVIRERRRVELDRPAWTGPAGVFLLTIDPDSAVVTTPRGVEIDLRETDLWDLSDVCAHVETIEAL